MIETWISNHISERPTEAGFRILRPVNQSLDSAVDQSPGTHRTGLQGDEYRTTDQPPPLQGLGGLPNREHLGVRQRISVDFAAIEAATDESPLSHDDSPDRHFTEIRRPFRLSER